MASKKSQDAPQKESPTPAAAPAQKPMVFISHDSRDADIAEAFANLLTDASGGTLRSFRSSDKRGTTGIEFGAEWYRAIMEKLDGASDVVALLTSHSVGRPWILYEAGVAKGKLNGVVFGLAVGVPLEKASVGPFAQFQNCSDDEESLTKLVFQLVKRIPDAEPREEAVKRQVQAFRSSLGAMQRPAQSSHPAKLDEASVAKLFEEVKVMFQELPLALERRVRGESHSRRRRNRMLSTPMVFEMALMLDRDSGSYEGLVMLAGVLREDAPWLAEAVNEVRRSLLAGDTDAFHRAQKGLHRMCDFTAHGPISEELFGENRDTISMLSEIPHFVDHYVGRHRPTPKALKPRAK